MTGAAAAGPAGPVERPPLWLIVATAAMAFVLLAMSVSETSFKGQYLIDQGEYLSLVGLVFILVAGLYLHRRGRLLASMPLVFPWLLYPVITQGDQIIDNLSITWMRIIVHVLLAAIFAMPIAVVVYGARWLFGLSAAASKYVSAALLTAAIWLAYEFLGLLMIGTLVVMIAAVLRFGNRPASAREASYGEVSPERPAGREGGEPGAGNRERGNRERGNRERGNQTALWILIAGVAISGGLYLGFKNRPGAYQGSPSFYMDPAQPGSGFQSAVGVPTGPVDVPANAADLERALTTYAASLQKMLDGYYVLDRNYNYHFHNELFLRSTPLLPDYRAAGLGLIADAGRLRAEADTSADRITLADGNPLKALLADVRAYAAFSAGRAATLERMSAEFETTKAGLQHATHIYEGEGKYLGVQLAALLARHQAVLSAPAVAPIVSDFTARSRAIHDQYSNRIVGF